MWQLQEEKVLGTMRMLLQVVQPADHRHCILWLAPLLALGGVKRVAGFLDVTRSHGMASRAIFAVGTMRQLTSLLKFGHAKALCFHA